MVILQVSGIENAFFKYIQKFLKFIPFFDQIPVESELSSSVGRHAPTPKLQPGEHCSDKLPICLTVYAQYACLNDPHFVRECPVTCGLCQPSDDTSSGQSFFILYFKHSSHRSLFSAYVNVGGKPCT